MNLKFTTLVLAAAFFCGNSLHAADRIWTWSGNAATSAFSTKSNWTTTDGDAAIDVGDTISIINGATIYPVLTADIAVNSLMVNGGWFFANGFQVTVTNNILVNSGYLLCDNSLISANNLYVNGGEFAVRGDRINISNDVILDGGLFFVYYTNDAEIPANLFLMSGTLDLNGRDLIVNNEFTHGGGLLLNVGNLSIENMIVDFNGIELIDYSINVLSSMQFINGIIGTNSTDMVIFDHDASTSGAGNSSHISGPVRRLVASSGNTTFEFPVGNDSVFAPIGISNFAQTRDEDFFTAQYFENSAPYDHTSKDFTLDHISGLEYWILNRAATSGTPSTDVNVRLSFDETNRSGTVDDASELSVAKWDGSSWIDLGYASASGNNTAGSFQTTSAVTSFSPFTIASVTAGNPLPVTLLDFKAIQSEKNVKVVWSTTFELNNDFYTVQKSMDGRNWLTLGTLDAVENSTQLTFYSFVDPAPVDGIQFYRLIQTDLNGKMSASHSVSVNFMPAISSQIITVIPNPVTDKAYISLNETVSNAVIRVYNTMGMLMMELTQASGIMLTLDVSMFDKGIYTIEVRHDSGVNFSRIVKN